jgi:gamma-glutamyltranspeptidase
VANAATPFAAETAISVLNTGGMAFDAAIAAAQVNTTS